MSKAVKVKKSGALWMPLLTRDQMFDILTISGDGRRVCERILSFCEPVSHWPEDSSCFSEMRIIKGVLSFEPAVYIPEPAYRQFIFLNEDLKKEMRHGLEITSGYQAIGFRLIVFLAYFYDEEWDFQATIKKIVLPGKSQHADFKKPALDFRVEGGNGICFADSDQFEWLRENAERYGFAIPYDYNNKEGISFSPWHWRYVGN